MTESRFVHLQTAGIPEEDQTCGEVTVLSETLWQQLDLLDPCVTQRSVERFWFRARSARKGRNIPASTLRLEHFKTRRIGDFEAPKILTTDL